jgi:hypothetical protein
VESDCKTFVYVWVQARQVRVSCLDLSCDVRRHIRIRERELHNVNSRVSRRRTDLFNRVSRILIREKETNTHLGLHLAALVASLKDAFGGRFGAFGDGIRDRPLSASS